MLTELLIGGATYFISKNMFDLYCNISCFTCTGQIYKKKRQIGHKHYVKRKYFCNGFIKHSGNEKRNYWTIGCPHGMQL